MDLFNLLADSSVSVFLHKVDSEAKPLHELVGPAVQSVLDHANRTHERKAASRLQHARTRRSRAGQVGHP